MSAKVPAMGAIECCKCHLPYDVADNPLKSLCPYCGAYSGDEIVRDVARWLILRPARVSCRPVRRKSESPYLSRSLACR